jgi:hypothetical protein
MIIRRSLIPRLLTLLLLTSALLAQARERDSSQTKATTVEPGEITNGIYKNGFFGLSYRIRYGWVDRTDETREASNEPAKATVLLAIFERPPLATGSTVNSSVVIAAESVSSYPGLKNAAQYFGPVGEVTEAKGLKPVNEPYEFPVDGKPIVRQDFIKQISNVGMHQSTLAMLIKGYVLSFTFIGSSDEEVQQMIEWLRIVAPSKPAKNSHKSSKP